MLKPFMLAVHLFPIYIRPLPFNPDRYFFSHGDIASINNGNYPVLARASFSPFIQPGPIISTFTFSYLLNILGRALLHDFQSPPEKGSALSGYFLSPFLKLVSRISPRSSL